MDMNQYLDIFVEESREHLQSLNSSLLELEKDPSDKGVLTRYSVAHTLKGMSGTMGFTECKGSPTIWRMFLRHYSDRCRQIPILLMFCSNVWMPLRLMSIIFSQQAMKEPRNIMRL